MDDGPVDEIAKYVMEKEKEKEEKKRIQEQKEKEAELRRNGVKDDVDENTMFYNDTAKRTTAIAVENAVRTLIKKGKHHNLNPKDKFIINNSDEFKIYEYDDDNSKIFFIPEKISELNSIENLPYFLANKIAHEQIFRPEEFLDIKIPLPADIETQKKLVESIKNNLDEQKSLEK